MSPVALDLSVAACFTAVIGAGTSAALLLAGIPLREFPWRTVVTSLALVLLAFAAGLYVGGS